MSTGTIPRTLPYSLPNHVRLPLTPQQRSDCDEFHRFWTEGVDSRDTRIARIAQIAREKWPDLPVTDGILRVLERYIPASGGMV